MRRQDSGFAQRIWPLRAPVPWLPHAHLGRFPAQPAPRLLRRDHLCHSEKRAGLSTINHGVASSECPPAFVRRSRNGNLYFPSHPVTTTSQRHPNIPRGGHLLCLCPPRSESSLDRENLQPQASRSFLSPLSTAAWLLPPIGLSCPPADISPTFPPPGPRPGCARRRGPG